MTAIFRQTAIEQIAEIQKRLVAMQTEPPFGDIPFTAEEAEQNEKIVRALRKAAEWLTDVVQPLTPDEQKVWDGEDDDGLMQETIQMYADDKSYRTACALVEDHYNDAMRRSDIQYNAEMEKDDE